ncbi:hypothetical protein [Cesiribacter sp. SM1]|uniref:hypothetical protein n=1 Tax=Cesiribacter sp. SM1 TaxID=2861196 RepID=UPI001CD1C917|nr:hypothetical protein [Cesiribacter sp. SM1]
MRTSYLIPIFIILLFSCNRRQITSADFRTERYKARKINVINISDEVFFKPQSGDLIIERVSQDFRELLSYLAANPDTEVEIRVSHVYKSQENYEEGLRKSQYLKNFFTNQGISESRITNSTFLDRRSKYPYNSEFRKVLLVVTNI